MANTAHATAQMRVAGSTPKCTSNGADSAPNPKHRCNTFIARLLSEPSSQSSIAFAPTSQAEAPMPVSANTTNSAGRVSRDGTAKSPPATIARPAANTRCPLNRSNSRPPASDPIT